jgi:aspartate aminotransferase
MITTPSKAPQRQASRRLPKGPDSQVVSVSKLAASVPPSATLAAGAKARQLQARGITVYDFSLGEPDQNTPAHIADAAATAVRAGATHYTPVSGTAEARAAVVNWYKRLYCHEVDASQVVITSGAKHGIHNGLAATVGPGDEVIIPTPYWVSYSDMVSMTGAKPILVPTTFESGFKLDPKALGKAFTKRTRLLMLNSPCNPTGTVYTRGELETLADVVLDSEAGILSDEIYEQLCYDDAQPTCIAALRPELAERTITIGGASKSFAMTGWRMGWTISPVYIAAAMSNLQSQETGCSSSVGQAALVAALEGPQDCVAAMRQQYAARRDLVTRRLQAMPGIRLHQGMGAFYAFFDISSYFGRSLGGRVVTNSAEFCEAALETAHVNFVCGSAFGAEGYARMSYACSRSVIDVGLDRFEAWLINAK